MQELGRRRSGQDPQPHAGAPKKIRGQSAPRLGYSGGWLGSGARCRSQHDGRSAQSDGLGLRVGEGFYEVTDLPQRVSEQEPVEVSRRDEARMAPAETRQAASLRESGPPARENNPIAAQSAKDDGS